MIESNEENSQGGLRADGRRALELRQIRIRMGVFGQVDGSAYIEHGNTKVLAAVYGPHQVKITLKCHSKNMLILTLICTLTFDSAKKQHSKEHNESPCKLPI